MKFIRQIFGSAFFRRIWQDSVWSGVIAKTIWVFGAALFLWIASKLSDDVAAVLASILRWLVSSSTVPNWILLVGGAAVLLWLVPAVRAYRRKRATPTVPEWKKYLEDEFFDMKWGWTWGTSVAFNSWELLNSPNLRQPRCIKCDSTLMGSHDGYDGYKCVNENCGRRPQLSRRQEESRHEMLNVITIEIERRVRAGEYPNAEIDNKKGNRIS